MDTIRKVVIFISLLSSISAHLSVPSILVQEGQSAEISCLAKGSHDAYFWWKGESLHNSTEIASFVGGIPSSPTGSYKATENGTLIITKVSLSDEGKYICRVSSAFSDCNGVIMVYVQASIPDFALGIDLCDGDTSCVIQIAPPKSTKLICQATDASPSMELKWFNGSTEITKGIEFEDPVTAGTSRVISATLNVAPECAGSLICQAVDPKTKDDGGRFAHVQLELPGNCLYIIIC
ncbi:hypothetical protein BSL78_08128 [Apostichopus japonicus]|uniref:Ig-like domain-containing protein n=1 Tax=Stichopus japonicus TaxID=307972 RepID=A0A2G8L3Z5_STIJA|nr:hypothetical protein BSL78_08128 [Apostichopus japonicus]